ELARLWESGYSASAIGRILGVSKNAVVGKAHRMRLAARPSPIRHERRNPVRRRIPLLTRPQGAEASPATKPAATPTSDGAGSSTPPNTLSVTASRLATTRNNGKGPRCLWPIGDPREPDFHFCGAPAVDGKPYCSHHCARAYIVRTPRGAHEAA
ncbi:MAG: GcrA cell cycle regulator, partial [Alphaproteobacteria bacterium]